jgi:hypothetical protein
MARTDATPPKSRADRRSDLEMRALLAALFLCISIHSEDWQTAFAKIPIRTTTFPVHLTPPVELILTNFQPTAEIRAIVLMPGAADRLYFYDWGHATLPENPTLLDAITALTNKADLRIFVAPPFLLIARAYDDPSDPLFIAPDVRIDKLKLTERKRPGRTYFIDRPYDRLVPQTEKVTRLRIIPSRTDPASWHYYRLSFIGYDLTAREFLQALAYGTKTSVHIDRRKRATFAERPYVNK